MTHQRSTLSWNIGTIVVIALAALALSRQIGRSDEKLDGVVIRMEERARKDDSQDVRIGIIENRTTAVETDVYAIKDGRYNNVIQRLPNTPRIDGGSAR